MRSSFILAIAIAVSTFCGSAFAKTDAEIKKQLQDNITSLTHWADVYVQRRQATCTLPIQKTTSNVLACDSAYEMLILRFKTEVRYNELRINALSLDAKARSEILDSLLTDSVMDDFNKETRRIEGWVVYLFKPAK